MEPSTLRLVAQCFIQLHYRVLPLKKAGFTKFKGMKLGKQETS
jgi:hypothetical protein